MCSIRVEPRIETQRLVLRSASQDYIDRVVPLINDFDIARMTSRIPHPYGSAEAEAYRAHQAAREGAPGQTFQVETREGELIGCVGVDFDSAPFPEIGYWLGRAYWGKGYATEAAAAICDWAAGAFSVRALIAGHFSDNPASGQVLIKCGFLYTGEVQQRISLARGETAATRMMVWLA